MMRRDAYRMAVVLAAAVIVSASAGCYKHVIRAEGMGVQDVDVYEPNAPGGPNPIEQLEGAIWVESDQKKKRR